jgi:16S rRNA (guanine966-N2)-methyltransferase
VTRIVSGRAGGRLLQVPRTGTRPTSDRVREALFSSLDSMLELSSARVLDLYAGTGAVGLEALSRGAAHVTLVESGREAGLVVRRNVETIGLPGAVVRHERVESFLASSEASPSHPAAPSAPPAASAELFDLVFADPPYGLADGALDAVLNLLCEPVSWLADAAVVVIERSTRSAPPSWPVVIEAIKSKRYGDAVLWYGRRR